MLRAKQRIHTFLWPILAAFVAGLVGYVHHRWFFPLQFDGDAAAIHVLAKAMLEENSLLPVDFSYGNQLIFFRASPFIALATLMGFSGHKAFMVGSSMSIAFWGVVLSWLLSAHLKSKAQGVLFSILLLIPIGNWDVDYVLGQQSHLANAVFSLGIVVSIAMYLADRRRIPLVIACACLFAMSSESPIRGLLVLGPLLLSIALVTNLKSTLTVFLPLATSFLLAYLTNRKILQFRPISTNYFYTIVFSSTEATLDNLFRTTRDALGSISSINLLEGKHLSPAGFIVLAGGILLTLCYVNLFSAGVLNAVKLAKQKVQNSLELESDLYKNSLQFVHLTATLGIVMGAIAVAALNPNFPRHYLWAVFLLKFVLFYCVYGLAQKRTDTKIATALTLTIALVLSSWFAYLVKFKRNIDEPIRSKNLSEAILDIRRASEQTGIRSIYGVSFNRMLPINTWVENLNAQDLVPSSPNDFYARRWLTLPSWSCERGDVLYFFKDATADQQIKKKLMAGTGKLIQSGADYSIWRGPRIWPFPSDSECEHWRSRKNPR